MSNDCSPPVALVRMLATGTWWRQSPAPPEGIADLKNYLNGALPEEYEALLRWSNGGEGDLPGGYFSLWPAEVVRGWNGDYGIASHLNGLVAIGTDGGDRAFALDFRVERSNPPVVLIELGDLDIDSVVRVGSSLADWIVNEGAARP